MFARIKQSTFYYGSNNCQFLVEISWKFKKRTVPDDYYLFISHARVGLVVIIQEIAVDGAIGDLS